MSEFIKEWTSKKKPRISILFPVYNEEKYLYHQLSTCIHILHKEKIEDFEILLIENGSTDHSWRKICQAETIAPYIRGLQIIGASYGRAIQHGILSAQGEIILILNIDFFDQTFIRESLTLINEKNCIVGSKTHPNSKDHRTVIRTMATRIHSAILHAFFSYPGHDTHGIKVLYKNNQLIKTLYSCNAKYEFFDTELLVKIAKSGVKIIELPVAIKEIRESRYRSLHRIYTSLVDIYRMLLAYICKKKMTHKRIVPVVADDYGMNAIASRAILNQFKAGTVDKISILANIVSAQEIANLSGIDKSHLGLHINLVRGTPILLPQEIPSIITAHYSFYSLLLFILRLLCKQISLIEVEKEILAQMKYLQKKGVNISYVDSEQHVHLFEPIYSIVKKIAKRDHLKVRSRWSTDTYFSIFPLKYIVLAGVSFLLKQIYAKEVTNDGAVLLDCKITHPGNTYD